MSVRVTPARRPADIDAVRGLLAGYFDQLQGEVSPADAARELAELPGPYAAPSGVLLLAWDAADQAVGCAGIRALSQPGACELKRLYVSEAGRRRGVGAALVTAAMKAARGLRYAEIFLDTLPTMAAAAGLYRRLGFTPVAPYHPDPGPGLLFFRRDLAVPADPV